MATSPDYARVASIATRPLTEAIFDALREAVVVIDARYQHLPLIRANASALRFLLDESHPPALPNRSLYSLLGDAAGSSLESALATLTAGTQRVDRILNWRFAGGEIPISTQLNLLADVSSNRAVMLTFAVPAAEPALLSAIEQLPRDLLILDRELTITYANAGAARTSGAATDRLLGHSALTVVPTSGVPREAFVRALAGGHFHDADVVVTTAGEPTRVFSVDIQPLKDATGIVGVTVLAMDVTEARQRPRIDSGDERRLSALTEHARDIITIAGRDGRLQYVSGGVMNALGYTPDERRSNFIFEHIHPEDVEGLRAKFDDLIAGRSRSFTYQFRIRHKDGSYRWLESTHVAALDNPLINGVVINSHDITEGKQAESQLAQRGEIFRLAADAVNGVIFEWDLDRSIVHRSRGVYDVLGLEPEEVTAVGVWSERIHPFDSHGYEAKVAAALHGTGCGWTATYRIRDARGRYRSMMERALIQRTSSGDPIRAIGCAVDISEFKRLTDLLAETQRAAMMGGWEYSYTSRELEWTDEMFSIFETTRQQFLLSWGAMLGQCTPDSRLRLDAALRDAETSSKTVDLELEIITLKQNRLWVRFIGRMEKLGGRPFRAFGSVQNVQSQKLSKIALETSTDWLKLSMNMAHMHAWRWTRSADTIEFAIVDGRMKHLPRVFPGMKQLMMRVHPKDRLMVRRAIDHAFEHHVEVHEEFRLKSRDGQYRSYDAVARPLFDAANQPSGLVGVTQDVTNRHLSEVRLRRSEELLRATTANTADTLLLVDTDLRVRFINRDIGDMTIEQIIGQDIAVLLPPPMCEGVIAKLRTVLTTGSTATFEFAVEVPGLPTEHFENRAVLVRDDGIASGISIAVRNITERRRLEQEVLDVSSRERQRIGRDLHDGLGQELTGVALMLRGLAKRVKKQAPDSINDINEIVGLVNQSIETARTLARGLLPVNTDNGGLSCALRQLALRCQDLYGLEVDFREQITADMALSEANASHLYRIAQEALTNTARHGHASRVTVVLLLSPTRFMLSIADDGVGVGEAAASATGMGLKIMKYRASMIGAKLEIVPNQPQGTVVLVTCDQPVMMSTLQSVHAI